MNQEKRMGKTLASLLFSFLLFIVFSPLNGIAAPSLNALIVDGQNNHDWKATTPLLKDILEETGLFDVDVATSPAEGKPMDDFKPAFSEYDVVVLNYTGDDWSKETQAAFLDYVRSGGGVVVFHAANNAFPNWKEFNEIIGLGGWGGRNEKSGPMVRYRDGRVVLDRSPGAGGTHGAQREYEVTIRDKEHPITKGLPEVWMHAKDELYAKLRGPALNLHVLATSLSKVSNENEPMLFTIQYGEGRIFHDAMGHGPYAMSCEGFAFTLQRGTEWAATGRVTQTAVPGNFPTATQSRFRLLPVSIDAIKRYEAGQSPVALTAVEENIRNAGPSQVKEIEGMLIKVLEASDATFYAKQFACKMLRRMGSEACLPALETLLCDEKLSHMARWALQGLPSPKVNAILRTAAQELSGDLRIGIIGTLAQRGDREAVSIVAPWLESDDGLLVETCIKALGEIGGRDAAQALNQAQIPVSLQPLRDDSLLKCLDGWVANGGAEGAASVYERMAGDEEKLLPTRVAAYRGLIACNPQNGVSTMISLLESDELAFRRAAAGPFLSLYSGSAIVEAIAEAFPTLPTDSQVMLLGAAAARGERGLASQISQALQIDNKDVQIATIEALGVLGGPDEVRVLAYSAAQGGKIGAAAEASLAQIKDADEAILRMVQNSGKTTQAVLIRSLVARKTPGAAAVLLPLVLDSDANVRHEAIRGLSKLASGDDIPQILQSIDKLENESDVKAVEEAVFTVAKSIDDAEKRTELLTAAVPDSSGNLRVSVIRLLGVFGGEKPCRLVIEALKEGNREKVREAAFQSLVNWPDAAPMKTLFELAKSASSPEKRQAALQGYLRTIDLAKSDSIERTMKNYQSAMEIASTKDEKQLTINAVANRTNAAALSFLENYLSDPEISQSAIEGYKKIIKQLERSDVDRKTWKVSASNNSGNAKQAIDGKIDTRWDTAETQKPGQWFLIDLGSERTIEEITLDSSRSSGDYPRGYEVYFSFDGSGWGTPAIAGKGDKPVLTLSIPSKSARFIKIVQTGSVDGLYWSIHELTMTVSSDKEQLEHAYDVLKKIENE